MSLFGGIDLGTPADRNRLVLTRELELRRDRWTRDTLYRGGADLCLQHGKFRSGRVLPDEYRHLHGLSGVTCYFDALLAAKRDPSLRYCEGYAGTGHGDFISHAWCIAPDDGVLEMRYPTGTQWASTRTPNLPTLPPEHWAYWGVTFTTELVAAYDARYGLGMFDRSAREVADMRGMGIPDEEIGSVDGPWPMLTVPYDPNRKDLP